MECSIASNPPILKVLNAPSPLKSLISILNLISCPRLANKIYCLHKTLFFANIFTLVNLFMVFKKLNSITRHQKYLSSLRIRAKTFHHSLVVKLIYFIVWKIFQIYFFCLYKSLYLLAKERRNLFNNIMRT